MSTSPTVAILGSGSWGTAMAWLLGQSGITVKLWCRDAQLAQTLAETRHNPRHLSEVCLAHTVIPTADSAEALSGVAAAILAVPSGYLRSTCERLTHDIPSNLPLVVLSKGVELEHHALMADVVAEVLGNPKRIAVLSGPNHAEEISHGKVSAAVLATPDPICAEQLRALLAQPTFRLYVSQDVVGVEVCGAVKNVTALACGMAAGLEAGDNALAVLMTRGIAETARLAVALGADPLTPMGLAGMGDLVATCTSPHSRNRSFGVALVAGESLEAFEGRTHAIVEGARAAKSVLALAEAHHVEVPVTKAVYGILYEGTPFKEALASLLDRRPCEEFYGMETRGENSLA